MGEQGDHTWILFDPAGAGQRYKAREASFVLSRIGARVVLFLIVQPTVSFEPAKRSGLRRLAHPATPFKIIILPPLLDFFDGGSGWSLEKKRKKRGKKTVS